MLHEAMLLSHTLTVSFNLALSSLAWRYDMALPSRHVSSNAPAVSVHVDTCFRFRLIRLYAAPSIEMRL